MFDSLFILILTCTLFFFLQSKLIQSEGDVGIKPVGGIENSNIEEAHILPLTAAGYPGFYLFGRTTVGWLVESHTADKTAATGWTPTAHAQYYDPAQSDTGGKLVPLSASDSGFGVESAGLKNPRGPTMAKQFNNSMYAIRTALFKETYLTTRVYAAARSLSLARTHT